MRSIFVLILVLTCTIGARAQGAARDTIERERVDTNRVDTNRVDSNRVDTLLPVIYLSPYKDSMSIVKRGWDSARLFLSAPAVIYRMDHPVRFTISVRRVQGKDAIFYTVIGLLLFFALVRTAFPRYLVDLFRAYFRTTMKQRQVKEQLLQTPLPSLLLNVFFMLSVGLFLTLILASMGKGGDFTFWILYLYVVMGLSTIYLVKFITLKFLGWVFQMSEATDAYIFVVFATNKIISIAILPFLFVLPFAGGQISLAAETLGIITIGCLLIYRFFLSFGSVQRLTDIGFFHFLLYLAAFEVVPLLIINKLVLMFLA